MEIINENFPNNKASGGATPLNIFQPSCFTYQMLKDWINDALFRVIFLDNFTFEIITSVQQKDEATNKESYRPASVLLLLSKIFEKVICDQCSQYLQIYRDCLPRSPLNTKQSK